MLLSSEEATRERQTVVIKDFVGPIFDDLQVHIKEISESPSVTKIAIMDLCLPSLRSCSENEYDQFCNYIDTLILADNQIDLFEFILKGDEIKVIEIYRKIYDQGVEPKIFINDFLELLYYFKNIESFTLESTNFSLNDQEFQKIKDLNKSLDPSVLILFWQFTISTLDELAIVLSLIHI